MNLNNELGLVFRTIDPLASLVKENAQIPKFPKSIPNKTLIAILIDALQIDILGRTTAKGQAMGKKKPQRMAWIF